FNIPHMKRLTPAATVGAVDPSSVLGKEEEVRRQSLIGQRDLAELSAVRAVPDNNHVLVVARSGEEFAVLGDRHAMHGPEMAETHSYQTLDSPLRKRVPIKVSS